MRIKDGESLSWVLINGSTSEAVGLDEIERMSVDHEIEKSQDVGGAAEKIITLIGKRTRIMDEIALVKRGAQSAAEAVERIMNLR